MLIINKYIKISVLAIVLGFSSTACKDEFLDRPPQDQYTLDNFYKTKEELDLAVNPLYGEYGSIISVVSSTLEM